MFLLNHTYTRCHSPCGYHIDDIGIIVISTVIIGHR